MAVKRKKTGFTLIEMVIVLAITVIILGITSSMFITGNRVFSDSDVKSTLQMEANDIQEELTKIGMQGKAIKSVEINGKSDNNGPYIEKKYSELGISSINKMKMEISGYDKTSEYLNDGSITNPKEYSILFENGNLSVNSKQLSSHVYSFSVVPQNTEVSFANASSIQFNIVLRKEKGFSKVDYPINIKVTFRNK